MANIVEETLKVSGMMCNGCENTVVTAAKSVEGVLDAAASFEDGTVKIKYDADSADMLFIKMAINGTKYKVVE